MGFVIVDGTLDSTAPIYRSFRLTVLAVGDRARATSVEQGWVVEFTREELVAALSEAPTRTVARAVTAGRRGYLFQFLPFGDKFGLKGTVTRVRRLNFTIRGVNWMDGVFQPMGFKGLTVFFLRAAYGED